MKRPTTSRSARRRRLLFRPVWLLVFAGSFLLLTAMKAGERLAARREGVSAEDIFPPFRDWRPHILFGGMVIYALFRGGGFHPAFDRDYQSWLAATPWTSAQPLPLGPTHLSWPDLPVFALAAAGAWLAGRSPAEPLVVFASVYLLLTSLVLAQTRAGLAAAGLAFGLPLLIILAPRRELALLVAAGLYAVAYAGLRRSLSGFPWEEKDQFWLERSGRDEDDGADEDVTRPNILPSGAPKLPGPGWPYSRLGPEPPPEPVSNRTAALAGALVGWWAYAAMFHFRLPADPEGLRPFLPTFYAAGVLVSAVVALWRLGIYHAGCRPPVSNRGRLATGSLIIPGYDQVFLAPLCVVVIGACAPPTLVLLGAGPKEALAVTLSLVFFAAIALGPTLHTWRTTGRHRIVAGVQVG